MNNNQIRNRIDEIFIEMCEDDEISWYKAFDDSLFMDKFERALIREFDESIFDSMAYDDWCNEIVSNI